MPLEVGGIVARLGARFDDDAFDRFERRLEGARRDARNDVEADLKADVDTRGFDRFDRRLKQTEQDADRSSGRIGGALRKFGPAAGAAAVGATGALGLIGKSVIGTATDINESLSKNEVLFGKHADSVAKFADTTASSMGISKAAALEATGTFGNLFVALEIGPDKAAKMSTGLTTLAADLASFNNASPEEALEAIRSGLVGETEPLRRFGVNINDAALRTEALRMGLVKTTKEALTPQQKALAVNALLFKQTEKAQGDFARTSGGLANQQRILKARLSDAGAELGQKLLPVATKVVRGLNDLMDGSTKSGRAIRAIGGAARDVGSVVGRAFGGIFRLGKSIGDAFDGGNRDATRAGRQIRGTIDSIVRTGRDLGRSLGRIFNGVGDDLRTIARGFARAFSAIESVVQPVIRSMLPGVKRAIEGLATVVRNVVRVIAALFRGDFAEVFRGLAGIVRGALNLVRGALGAALSGLSTAAKKLGGAIVGGIVDLVTGIPGRVRTLVLRARSRLADLEGSFRRTASNVGRAVVGGIVDGISALGGKIADVGRSIGRKLINAAKDFLGIKSPSRVFMGIGRNVIEGLAAGLDAGDVAGIAAKAFGGLTNVAASLVKKGTIDVASIPIKGAKKLAGKVGNLLDGIFDRGGGGGGGGGDTGGLVARVRAALEWAREHGWKGSVTSGNRTRAEQQRLYDLWKAGKGNRAAPPGQSNHEGGQAVDVTDTEGFARAMASAPPGIRLRRGVPGEPWHFSVTGRRYGGPVGPGKGGPRAFIAGEGMLPEWVISQEGDRRANIEYAREALSRLTGRAVPAYRMGKGISGARRAVGAGEGGIRAAQTRIDTLEREYGRAERRFDLSEEEFVGEDANGNPILNKDEIGARAAELDELLNQRREIRRWLGILRDRLGRLRKTLKTAAGRFRKAAAGAKGKKGKARRDRYRTQAGEYDQRARDLEAEEWGAGQDFEDSRLDLDSLIAERAGVLGTTAPPGQAPAAEEAPAASEAAPAADGGTDAAAPEQLPPDPAEVAAQAIAQVGAFNAARADLFGSLGANFLGRGAGPLGEVGQAAGMRYLGGGSSGSDGGVLAGAGGIYLDVNFTGPQPAEPHTFVRAFMHELEAAI